MLDKTQEILRRKIERIGILPTLPAIATKVISITKSPRASMKDISEVISEDPSLAAAILRLANSALYGLRQQVDTLQFALIILGLREITNLVISVSVLRVFPKMPQKLEFDREYFWRHSAACAQFAKVLCGKLGIDLAAEAFTAGLVHDIGKIVLAQYFRTKFIQVIQLASDEKIPMLEAENRILGVGHTQIGSWLARKWDFPDRLVEAIALHHEPGAAQLDRVLTALVYLANLFCKAKDVAFISSMDSISFVDEPAWKILMDIIPDIAYIDLERLTIELDTEIERAEEFITISRGAVK
jgi:putative nucleotidyltransferase with HDIG domain